MERRSLGAGAAWGALLGIAVGYADGWSARASTLSGTWEALPWAVAVDGALGALAGLLLHRVLPRRAAPAIVLAGLGVAGAVGLAAADHASEAPPVAEVPGEAPSLLLLAVPGLPAELDALPATAARTSTALSLPRTFATATHRAGALAGLLGRDVADGVSLAEAARWAGALPLAVVQGDRAEDRALLDGFTVASALPPSPIPRGLAGVALARVLRPAPGAAPPSAVIAPAEALLRAAEGRRFVLVVELPPWDDATALDLALDALRSRAAAAAPGGLDVLLAGLPGPVRAGGHPLEPAATRTPAWLVRHDATDPSVRRGDTSAADLTTTWLAGVVREPVAVGAGTAAIAEPPARVVGSERDPNVGCSLFHDQDRAEPGVITQGVDGVVVRHAGFAVVLDAGGAPQALHDEVTDPYWGRDLLGAEGPLCGISAQARVTLLRERAAARRGVGAEPRELPPMPPVLPGAPRVRWPDPFAAFPAEPAAPDAP